MSQRPNILCLCADQLRWDALGVSGNRHARTPQLDRLAAAGTAFLRCYTPNPICVPARASITTGNYSHRATGSKDNGGLIRDDQPRMADLFAANGYRTYAIGKLHYVPYAPPEAPRRLHGFQYCELNESGRLIRQHDPAGERRGLEDYYDFLTDVGWGGWSRAHGIGNNDVRSAPSPLPAEFAPDAWVATRTIAALNRHTAGGGGGEPFLMWSSFSKPHSPYDPPRPWDTLFGPRSLPAPIGSARMLRSRGAYVEANHYGRAHDTLSPAALRVIKAYYYGLVSFQDHQVGRILAELVRLGLWENTVVLFMSDHGDLLGDWGAFFKCNHYEGSGHVPLLVAWPASLPAGQRLEHLVGLQDVLPTLCGLSGVDLGAQVHGQDLTPTLRDPATKGREVIHSYSLESPWANSMVFDGRFKYIYNEANAQEELYDLAADPQEMTSLAAAAEQRGRCRDMRARMIEWHRDVGETRMLDGGDLKATEVERDKLADQPVRGMGWRWY
jgi:arylsulfatase A-like enzyme